MMFVTVEGTGSEYYGKRLWTVNSDAIDYIEAYSVKGHHGDAYQMLTRGRSLIPLKSRADYDRVVQALEGNSANKQNCGNAYKCEPVSKQTDGWIPASVKPDVNQAHKSLDGNVYKTSDEYLCCYENDEGDEYYAVLAYDDDGDIGSYWVDNTGDIVDRVIAYREIPRLKRNSLKGDSL